MSIDWPDPRPDPIVERGENLELHLLPDLQRLRALTPEQRHALVDLVADWIGPRVEVFRARVRGL
jgi:hypothetical protein